MKPLAKIFLSGFALIMLAGCHQMNVKEITSRLRVGMSKVEMETALTGEKYLREQTVVVYPNSTEQKTRASLWVDHHYEFVYPEDLISKRLTLDGSVKVYSYLIKEERNYAVPVTIHYLAIFCDPKKDQVIGWAHLSSDGEVRTWNDKY